MICTSTNYYLLPCVLFKHSIIFRVLIMLTNYQKCFAAQYAFYMRTGTELEVSFS